MQVELNSAVMILVQQASLESEDTFLHTSAANRNSIYITSQ